MLLTFKITINGFISVMFKCVMLGYSQLSLRRLRAGVRGTARAGVSTFCPLWAPTQSCDSEGAEEGAEAGDMMEGDS